MGARGEKYTRLINANSLEELCGLGVDDLSPEVQAERLKAEELTLLRATAAAVKGSMVVLAVREAFKAALRVAANAYDKGESLPVAAKAAGVAALRGSIPGAVGATIAAGVGLWAAKNE